MVKVLSITQVTGPVEAFPVEVFLVDDDATCSTGTLAHTRDRTPSSAAKTSNVLRLNLGNLMPPILMQLDQTSKFSSSDVIN